MSGSGLRQALAAVRWASRDARRCGTCTHFDNDPRTLERTFSNLAVMSSGFASVKSRDGLCNLRHIYLPAGEGCIDHAA